MQNLNRRAKRPGEDDGLGTSGQDTESGDIHAYYSSPDMCSEPAPGSLPYNTVVTPPYKPPPLPGSSIDGKRPLLPIGRKMLGGQDARHQGVRFMWSKLLLAGMLVSSALTIFLVYRLDQCSSHCRFSSAEQHAFPGYHGEQANHPRQSDGDASSHQLRALMTPPQTADGGPHTLVVYVYSPTDPEYENNLRYFLREAVHEGDGCEYVFIIQQSADGEQPLLPLLPRGSRYIYHANECFDWGSFGWAIKKGHIQPDQYKYVIVMNSSVRGPFLPAYWPHDVHWSRILTSRLVGDVKLVGPTISCEGTDATATHEERRNPHVQSYVVAMDQEGYRLMRDFGKVFDCYKSLWDTIYNSELGSSLAVLQAGYNIDSLMLRYQGVDWRDQSNWGCNGGVNPYAEGHYDGINVNPFEVLFVKVKEFMLSVRWGTAMAASRYDQWSNKLHAHSVVSNAYNEQKPYRELVELWSMRQHDPMCFDHEYYVKKNTDLPPWPTDRGGRSDAWSHFLLNGQFEGRPFRWICDTLASMNPLNHSLHLRDKVTLPMTPSEVLEEAQIIVQRAK